MKIALAQINPTIGDFDSNVDLILSSALRAQDLGADLCVFPEQCIPGYPAHDLLERTRFIDQNLTALHKIARNTPDIGLIVGFAERTQQDWGKGLYNSAALLHGGSVKSIHRKSLLPTYDVFDERRYFDPARTIQHAEFKGVKLGITICEDVWNDPDFWSKRMYDDDPVADLKNKGATIIINISASPFTVEKRKLRRDMLKAAAEHHQIPLVFCNMVGGNDDLIFDGSSQVYDQSGELIAQGKEFDSDLLMVDLDTKQGDKREIFKESDEAALEALILGTRDYARKCGFSSGIVGLSGGIDSALVTVIAARALGKNNFETVLMPSEFSSESSIKDSLDLVHHLGISHQIIPIEPLYKSYLKSLTDGFKGRPLDTTEENLQARIRGNILMALSNKHGHLVLSTGNKSELATGYCTLYGDMAGGLSILSDVPKTMVYRLARLINRDSEIIPQNILDKAPSAELRPNQFDSDSLPSYDLLDAIIELHIVERLDGPAIVRKGYDNDTVKFILRMIRLSEYKRRQSAPGLKITSKAFGHGRRIPLAQRWLP